ncbi:SbcC/MukB-like Walker B domain-containing protein [Negadavirga shengliensis]|uniref:SbcC/MukB-like Walker B domain-containing protein n=1 Tax=Negadavirga shengliensis TaxID=1389218 RepID=A0ABV9SXU7_9BACT
MIPIKLDIQGLYSYKEKQTVDFRQLTAAGLFGIFGAVGSGKSSILEAILLALYGSTERLLAKGERNSMMNLQSDRMQVVFEFKAGKNNENTYLAQYLAKRDKKDPDKIKPADHGFYIWQTGKWQPVPQKGEDILGMKIDHFKQTVIIPQGKFRDFIDLTAQPRAEMMKELFGLERFDLSPQTSTLLKTTKEEKIKVETMLQGLEGVSIEVINAKTSLLGEQNDQKRTLLTEFEKTEKRHQQLTAVREKSQQLQLLTEKKEQLEKQRHEIEHRKKTLADYQKALTHLKPILDNLADKKQEAEKHGVSFRECERWKVDYEIEIEKLVAEKTKLEADKQKRQERESKIRDLYKVLEIQKLRKDMDAAQQELNQLQPKAENLKLKLINIEEEIQKAEKQEEAVEIPSGQELSAIQGLISQWEFLEKSLTENKASLAEIQVELEALQLASQKILSQAPEGLTLDAWLSDRQEEIENLRLERDKMMQHKGLSGFALELKEGIPCPLCGSPDHPSPLSHEFDQQAMETQEAILKKLQKETEHILSLKEALGNTSTKIQGQKELEEKVKTAIHNNESQISLLVDELTDKGFENQAALRSYIGEVHRKQEALQTLQKGLRQLRSSQREILKEKETCEHTVSKSEDVLKHLLTTTLVKKEEIRYADFCKPYFKKGPEEITSDIEKVQQRLDTLELESKRNSDRLEEARKKQATNEANLTQYKQLFESTNLKIKSLESQLTAQLEAQGFENEDEAIQLLSRSLDIKTMEQEIHQFHTLYQVTSERLKELEKDPAVAGFSENVFQTLEAQLQSEKRQIEACHKTIALLEKEIEDLNLQWCQKEELSRQLDKVEQRLQNLNEMYQLFKGSGFVKYISTIFLQELCLTANKRFMQLTKNSLSLEVDENNIFWVRDYLNSGKKRLLKTLSGGQVFQASLCLALALAEKIKSLNRADQSFFFLDEGFGALDKPSLRTVFETLKSLRNENRIVGIISHVEELQHEIEVHAKINLDEEKGSLIQYSF